MTTLASAFVEVRPDLSKFPALLKAGADASATTAGKSSGGKFSTAFQATTRGVTDVDPNTTSATSAGRVSGGRFGVAFEGAIARITDLDPDTTTATSAGRVTGVRFGAAFDGATARIGAIDADPGIASSAGRSTGAAFAQGFTMSTPDLGDVDADRGQAAAAGSAAGRSYGKAFALSSAAGGAAGGLGGAAAAGTAKTGILGMGAGLAVLTGLSVKLEAQFSSVMNQIQAATLAPQKEIQKLSDLAIKFGRDTVFSASDAGNAMLELAKGGISTATIRTGALEGALDLAAAGGLEMADAAAVMVSTFGQFDLAGKDATAVAAALAGAANASSSNVDDLALALRQGGLAANAVGFSVQETTGVLAAFANAGLRGSDAGTSLKTAMDRLQPATAKNLEGFRAMNLITEDGTSKFVKRNGEFKTAAQIAELLRKGTEDLSAADRKRAISAAFGSDAQRAASVLAKEGGAGIREMVKATSDLGAAQRIGAARMKGTAGAFEQLKGSAETVALQFGQVLAPAAQAVFLALAHGLNRLPGIFGKVADFIREHATLLKTIGVVIGALVLPWFLVLGAAFVVLWKKSETFRDIVKGAFHGVQIALAAVGKVAGPVFAELVDGFQFVVRFVRAQWPAVAKTVSEVFAQIKVGVRALFNVIRPLFVGGTNVIRDLWDKFGGRLVDILRKTYDLFKTVLKNGFKIVEGIFQAALAVLRGDWSEAWDHIKKALAVAWDSIKVIVRVGADIVKDVLRLAWDVVKSATRNAWDAVKESIRDAWDGIKSILNGVKDFLLDKVVGAFDWVVDKVRDIWNALIEIALKPINFFINTIYNDGIRPVFNKISGLLDLGGDGAQLPRIAPLDAPPDASSGGGRGPKRARGGVIPGLPTPEDSVTAFVRPGESVFVPEFTKAVGGERGVRSLNDAAMRGKLPPMHAQLPDPRSLRRFFLGGVMPLQPVASISKHDMSDYPWARWAGDLNGPGNDHGQAIRAWAAGKVASVLHSAVSYGNETNINHPGRGKTKYAHQSAQIVRGGQDVRAGEIIGRVGNTGRSYGSHLHFELAGGTDAIQPGGGGRGGGGGNFATGIARAVLQAVRASINAIKADIAKGLSGDDRWTRNLAATGGMAVEGLQDMLAKAQASAASSGTAGSAGSFGSGASGVWKSLMSTGFYTKTQAAGVMGNMEHESGFDPQIVQGGGHSRTAGGISSGYGLVQWTPGTKLASYIGANTTATIANSVDALTAQLQGKGAHPEGAAGSALRRTHTPTRAANVFGLQYERYAGPPQSGRAVTAEAIFRRFAGGKGTHDQGGRLRSGEDARNRSGKDEMVLTNAQWRDIRKLIAAVFVGHKPSAITPEFITGQLDREAPSAAQLKNRYGAAMKDYREQLEQARGAREALNQAERRAKNLNDAIDKARKAGHKDHMKDLKERRDEIQKLVRQRDRDFDKQKRQSSRAEEAAKKAAAAYAAAQRAAIEQAKTVAGSVTGLGSLANSPFRSSAGIVGNLRRSILIAKDWGSVVKNLIKAGLRGPILQEFIAEGPSFEAVALGRNLLRAGDIDEIVALQDRLARIGREVGGIAVSDPRRGGGRRAGQAIDRARTGTGTRERRSTIDRLEVHFHGVYDTPAAMAQELGAELARKGIY